MKAHILLVALAALTLVGCATTHEHSMPMSKNEVRNIDIRSAAFGSGTNVTNVTSRVVFLLRSKPAGFAARYDILQADPLPYTTKCLVIDYYYYGRPYQYAVPSQAWVSYDLLVKMAQE